MQAHESARRAFDKGPAASRAYSWLHLYNRAEEGAGHHERRAERWNREVGTRIGSSVGSVGEIGPALVGAASGGFLMTAAAGGSAPGAGTADGNSVPGAGTGGGKGGKGGKGDEGGKADDIPCGTENLMWDFVL